MRAQAVKLLDQVRASYWFIPSLMALAGAVLSFVMLYIDRTLTVRDWLSDSPWLFLNQPTAARIVLQTIAGSMVTVAGVTFSITIATVANATIQFGPRLLTSFMRNRGNQITLGTFISTFVYCLSLLRAIRGDDGYALTDMFVPNLGVIGGLALAILSLGNLIYFFHHIPESIHVTNLIAGVGAELNDQVRKLYPTKMGHARIEQDDFNDQEQAAPGTLEGTQTVTSKQIGYVQTIDGESLIANARAHGVLIYVISRPGSFVSTGVPLVLVRPADNVNGALKSAIRRCFGIGVKRTARQDVLFLVNQLVEVAARALSPGIQDPFTAIYCLYWLRTVTIELAEREMPSPYRLDTDNNLRVVASPVTFAEFTEAAFGQLRPYVVLDRNVALQMAEDFKIMARAIRQQEYRQVLGRHVSAFYEECEKNLFHSTDLRVVETHLKAAVEELGGSGPTLAFLREEHHENGEEGAT